MGRTHTHLTKGNSEYTHTHTRVLQEWRLELICVCVCVQGGAGVPTEGAGVSVGAILSEVCGSEASAAAQSGCGATREPERHTDGATEERQPGTA